jgi:hypothetical protein
MALDQAAAPMAAACGVARGTTLIVPSLKPVPTRGRGDSGSRAVTKQVFAAASAELDARCGQ